LLWDSFTEGRREMARTVEALTNPQTLRQRMQTHTREMNGTLTTGAKTDHNLLSTMPSIEQLAMSVDDLNGPDVMFADLDIDYAVAVDSYEPSDNSVSNEGSTGEESPGNSAVLGLSDTFDKMKFKAQLPKSVLYQIHMQNEIHSHRDVDLSILDDVTRITQLHANRGVDMKNAKMYTRDQLLEIIEENFNLHHLKPKLVKVPTEDGYVSVGVFNVKAQILSILHDPKIMHEDNFADGYDIMTGKVTHESDRYAEVHDGWLWEKARAHYCSDGMGGDDPDVFPLGLVCFYDKTHTDHTGALSCAPLIAVPTFLKLDLRMKAENQRVLGYVPNLSYGRSGSSRKLPRQKLQEEHDCLRQITKQLADMHKQGGFWTKIMGQTKRVVVFIFVMCGDASGQNNLVCLYNSHGDTMTPNRECICPYSDLSSSAFVCVNRSLAIVEEARKSSGGLASISMHNVRSAFDGVPFADLENGIYGSVPSEDVHTMGTGVVQRCITSAVMIIGPKETKKKEKELLDTLHQMICGNGNRQSDRDFPRNAIRNGVCDPTKTSSAEVIGNFHGLLMVTYTTEGRKLFTPFLLAKNISMRDFRLTMKLLLGYKAWLNLDNLKVEVHAAGPAVEFLLDLVKRCFPKDEGNGWNLPKYHACTRFPYSIGKFSCQKGFSGEWGERALKYVAKDLATQTQRRPSVFADQIAVQNYNTNLFKHAYKHAVVPYLGLDYEQVVASVPETAGRGEYVLTVGEVDHLGRGLTQVVWKNKKRDKLKIGIDELMKTAIMTFSSNHNWTGMFSVTGYTSYKLEVDTCDDPILFHANEYVHGGPWYDWCMVQFEAPNAGPEETLCPAKILGFFKYTTAGTPTPYLVNDLEYSPAHVSLNNIVDDTVYAVVHTSSTYMQWDQLEEDFVRSFKLGDITKDCLHIRPTRDIKDPLWVIRDIGGAGNTGDKYFCSLPYRMWGNYFRDRIRATMDD